MNGPDHLRGIRGVVLDWDRTMVDNGRSQHQSLVHALAPYGLTVTADWYADHAGLPIRETLRLLASDRDLPIEDVVAKSRAYLLRESAPDPIPATLALVRQARARRLRLAIASSAEAVLVHAGIRHLGLTGVFTAVVTAESVTRPKPAPDPYLEAARRLDLPPAHCLAVDDAPEGIHAALTAGMRVLAVRDGALHPVPAAAPHHPTYTATPTEKPTT
ncbi:HAD family phosphatase [Kitasatospora sp. NPDC086791]|uniref:HAD family hydrolase n=1 Tax=Kitasatospora sp. NPDC086791 TaxID=3155178 RepID=UPI003439B201